MFKSSGYNNTEQDKVVNVFIKKQRFQLRVLNKYKNTKKYYLKVKKSASQTKRSVTTFAFTPK